MQKVGYMINLSCKQLVVATLILIPSLSFAQVKGDIQVVTNMSSLIDNGWFNKAVASFKRKHPAVGKVTIVRTQNFNAEAPALFESRSYGDLTLIPEHIPKDAYKNYFLPLNDLNISDKLYFANAWEFDGKHYAYTQGVIAEGLVYNRAIFKRLNINPPKTLNEFYQACKLLKQNNIVPIALNAGSGWPLQQWDKAPMAIASNGDYHATMLEQSQPFTNNSAYYQSFKIVNTIFKNAWSEQHLVGDKWEDSKVMFVNEQLAMYFLGSWLIPQLAQKGAPAQDIGFIPFPFSNDNKVNGLLNRDWGLAVSRFSKNPDTAKAFLSFILFESDFADAAGFIPTNMSAQAKIPQMREYQAAAENMVQAASPINDFIRLTNMAGIDFMQGGYVRDILISSDFEQALQYWDRKWSQAKVNLAQ